MDGDIQLVEQQSQSRLQQNSINSIFSGKDLNMDKNSMLNSLPRGVDPNTPITEDVDQVQITKNSRYASLAQESFSQYTAGEFGESVHGESNKGLETVKQDSI